MIEEKIGASGFLEVASREVEEGSSKLLLRVRDPRAWERLLGRLLRGARGQEDFGLAVNKSYFLDDAGELVYCWVVLTWGDLEEADAFLGEEVERVRAQPRPPPAAVVSAPPHRKASTPPPSFKEAEGRDYPDLPPGKIEPEQGDGKLVLSRVENREKYVVVTRPLPHQRGPRHTRYDRDSVNKIKHNGERRIKAAVVTTIGDDDV